VYLWREWDNRNTRNHRIPDNRGRYPHKDDSEYVSFLCQAYNKSIIDRILSETNKYQARTGRES